ncbi:hypothetical protein SAMN05216350_105309 [Polaromonas sp. YR568]|uniref:hypothetical protein n=1 Tax=Polaromonas sp. YR568 TaxID=1855301 RepID=UPI0008E4128E|nr:hypothetical protein [Polaromonas sp. YR568]SFU81295.1 hypothetical protein SAMN05216350_105309 [Polaromonas sp. YR568]
MIWKNALDEFKRSPIAAASGAVGVLVGALSLLLAWIQFQTAQLGTSSSSGAVSSSVVDIKPANLLLVIAFFLATTIACASVVRLLGRKHELAALFVSVPLAALTNFATMLVIYLAPPRVLSQELFTSANDLALYASAAIFMSFCGQAVLVDIAAPSRPLEKDGESGVEKKNSDGIGVLFLGIILLIIWTSLVFAGQIRLSRTFLPEIAHPVDAKPNKPAT